VLYFVVRVDSCINIDDRSGYSPFLDTVYAMSVYTFYTRHMDIYIYLTAV